MARRKISFIEKIEEDDSERRTLGRFFPQEQIGKIELRLINREFMTKRSYESYFDPGNCEAQENGVVYCGANMVLLDDNGNQICVVGMERKPRNNRFWEFWERWFVPERNRNDYRCFPESTQEALARIGDQAKKVVFVLEFDEGTLILHQPKKGLTLLAWLEVLKKNSV